MSSTQDRTKAQHTDAADNRAQIRDAIACDDAAAFQEACRQALTAVHSAEALSTVTGWLLDDEVVEYIDQHAVALSPLGNTWSRVLLETAFTAGNVSLSYEFLALPPLFRWWKWRATQTARWQQVRERVAAPAARPDCPPAERLLRRTSALFIDGLLEPLETALDRFLDDDNDVDVATGKEIGRHLERYDWYLDAESLPARLRDRVPPQFDAGRESLRNPLMLLDLLGFFQEADKQWCATLFRELALPWLLRAIDAGEYDVALQLENRIYNHYVKQTETTEHFRACTSQWIPAMAVAGRDVGSRLPPLAPLRAGTAAPKVAFILYSPALLAHTDVLFTLFRALRRFEHPPFEPVVYALNGDSDDLQARLAAVGVPIVFMGGRHAPPGERQFGRILRMRARLQHEGVTAVLWVTIPITMALAFSIRLAPVQIWWAMKQHALELADIDAYLTTGATGEWRRDIAGRSWRTLPAAIDELFDPRLAAAAHEVRARYSQYSIILGSVGRPEKLDSTLFLDALERILKANPRAVFLWFGRTRLTRVAEELEHRGIAEQCVFCGWQDTRVYAQVLDIHLDTFPFPMGLTMFQTVAAGVACVTYRSEEALQNGMLTRLWPLLSGETGSREIRSRLRKILTDEAGDTLLLCAETPDQYVQYVQRLIDDADFRARVGATGPQLVRVFNDPVRMVRVFSAHLTDVMTSVLKRRQSAGETEPAPANNAAT